MKRNIILALLMLWALGGALLAKEAVIIKVKVQLANVRSEPLARATIVAKVPGGTLLEVADQVGDWFEVSVNDKSGREITGFIRNTVVEVVGGGKGEDAAPRRAQRRSAVREENGSGMRFGLNFGAQTDDGFSFDPFLWTVGVELDFQFGDFLMLGPEVMLVGNGFEFKQFILYPAVILNFTAGNFFIGAGMAKGFFIGSGMSGSTDFLLKLNAGLIARNVKLSVYALMAFDSLFKDMALGATLGFRF